MNAITLGIHGPLVGMQKRNMTVAHAITLEAFCDAGFGQRMPTAPCGAKHLRFLSMGERGNPVLWPIAKKGGPIERCEACWIATGKKRPRSKWSAT